MGWGCRPSVRGLEEQHALGCEVGMSQASLRTRPEALWLQRVGGSGGIGACGAVHHKDLILQVNGSHGGC